MEKLVTADQLITGYKNLNAKLNEAFSNPNAETEKLATKVEHALESLENYVDKLPEAEREKFCEATGYSGMTLEEAESRAQ